MTVKDSGIGHEFGKLASDGSDALAWWSRQTVCNGKHI
tara:strand:- start:1745 stop:1858 length:114 start_codon:yes stop_codon:yes gene_type:complete